MTSGENDRFRVKPAPPESRGGRGSQHFVSQVLKQVSKAGAPAFGPHGERPASTFGRGRVAAGIAGRSLSVRARRVVIKSRYVVLKRAGAKSVSTHLRYIERDGVTRDGARGQAYGRDTDAADLKAFEERGRGDRHQFRFIVSVEDAEQLHDLRAYTRDVMQRMATDLETELDWVAVDHWDTDNPHTHVVLRGRASDGQDLVIAPDYMAHGMRIRASEVATEWLGPRTELEIKQGLLREVEGERLTSIDRALLREASEARAVDLARGPGDSRQSLQRARLQRLEAMGLAARLDGNRWVLAPELETTLVQLGERGDILRTMQRALQGQHRECVAEASARDAPIVGRIAAKGLADELNDRGYLVVDGIDGRAHYVRLPVGADLSTFPHDGVVEVRPQVRARSDGRAAKAPIPDYLDRARCPRRGVDLVVEVRSLLPVEQQASALGATWLDRQLLEGRWPVSDQGFAAAVRRGMQQRVIFLQGLGLAERRGQHVVLARNLLAAMQDREVEACARALSSETGLAHRCVREGEGLSGVYRRDIRTISGRFAMLDHGASFSLVPWQPVLERCMGRSITATVQGASVTLSIDRYRGVSF